MTQNRGEIQGATKEILERVEAVITNSHFVYNSWLHGSGYVKKDALYAHPLEAHRLGFFLARLFEQENPQVVLAPAMGGIILGQWVAYHLSHLLFENVLSIYAEKDGDEFLVKRGYEELIQGKRILVVEDILTTGRTARKVVNLGRKLGGVVIGLGAICNRGEVTREGVGGVPMLKALLDITMETYKEDGCPLCKAGVPIDTSVGHGKEFMERRAIV